MSEEKLGLPLRGLQEGFAGTPLRRFKGVFQGHEEEAAKGYDGTRTNLNFTEVEVIQSTEPYNFPIASINLGVSNKKESRWGYFATSLTQMIPEDEGLDEQVGRTWELVFCDGQDGRPEPKPIWMRDADRATYPDGRVPTAVWTVVEIEGIPGKESGTSKGNSRDKAMSMLDGKSLSEFNKVALADPAIRKDVELQRRIMDKSFVKALLDGGVFTKDENDVYHKAEE